MVCITPYDATCHPEVRQLAVQDEQRLFVGDVAATLASLGGGLTGYVITWRGQPAGFFLIDLDYASHYGFAAPGSVGLRSFFIAQQYQGQGLAKAALAQLGDYLCAQGIATQRVYLTVNCRNLAAAALYRRCGFCDEGQLYLGGPQGPQHIMHLGVGSACEQ